MESSVEFSHSFDLWNTFCAQNGYNSHMPKEIVQFSWGIFCCIKKTTSPWWFPKALAMQRRIIRAKQEPLLINR